MESSRSVKISAQPLLGCVSVCKSLYLLSFCYPHLQNGDNGTHSALFLACWGSGGGVFFLRGRMSPSETPGLLFWWGDRASIGMGPFWEPSTGPEGRGATLAPWPSLKGPFECEPQSSRATDAEKLGVKSGRTQLREARLGGREPSF